MAASAFGCLPALHGGYVWGRASLGNCELRVEIVGTSSNYLYSRVAPVFSLDH